MPWTLRNESAMRERRIAACIVTLLGSHMICSGSAIAEEGQARAALLLAARYDKSALSAENAPLGKPVIVSRFDSEASVSRVRSVEILPDSVQFVQPAPTADPAFKAVFLTPRGSTGRPVPIQMASFTKPDESATRDESATKTEETSKPLGPAPNSTALIPQEKTAPKMPLSGGTSAHPSPNSIKSQGSRQSYRSAPPEQKAISRPQIAKTERSNYGAAEIGATRAFTRF